MFEQLFNAFMPHRCCNCLEIGQLLCESCKYDILNEPFSGCLLCLGPCGPSGICNRCQRDSLIDQAWCAGLREGALKSFLDGYKFDCRRGGYRQIADLMEATIPRLDLETIVLGVPSSPKAVRQRGFSHVELFAKEFAKRRSLQYYQYLERASSETLHFLSKQERVALGPELFRIKDVLLPEAVLLVDDILTTGTTMMAACRLLKQNGVQYVYAIAIARQNMKDVWG